MTGFIKSGSGVTYYNLLELIETGRRRGVTLLITAGRNSDEKENLGPSSLA